MEKYIPRKISTAIENAAKFYQVIVVTGPRQVGKTTLCKRLFNDYKYFNFEDVSLREIVESDTKGFLDKCGDKVIIDEVQRAPNLLSYIQLAVDENPDKQYILTGSSNFSLLENITQSLAGRAALFTLLQFSMDELSEYSKSATTNDLLFQGLYPAPVVKGFPASQFYRNYYSTYIERDVRQIINIKNIDAFQTFIRLCAGRTGTEFNASSIATEVGMSAPTIKEWLTILQTSYIIFKLQPYYANINKRLVKTPKIYFYDTGILCFLLGIESPEQLSTHPLRGSIFENLAVVELLKHRYNDDKTNNLYYYRENSGKEVDILQTEGNDLHLYEVKSSMTYNSDFKKNLIYLNSLFGNKIKSSTVVYDGNGFPPDIINIRDI